MAPTGGWPPRFRRPDGKTAASRQRPGPPVGTRDASTQRRSVRRAPAGRRHPPPARGFRAWTHRRPGPDRPPAAGHAGFFQRGDRRTAIRAGVRRCPLPCRAAGDLAAGQRQPPFRRERGRIAAPDAAGDDRGAQPAGDRPRPRRAVSRHAGDGAAEQRPAGHARRAQTPRARGDAAPARPRAGRVGLAARPAAGRRRPTATAGVRAAQLHRHGEPAAAGAPREADPVRRPAGAREGRGHLRRGLRRRPAGAAGLAGGDDRRRPLPRRQPGYRLHPLLARTPRGRAGWRCSATGTTPTCSPRWRGRRSWWCRAGGRSRSG